MILVLDTRVVYRPCGCWTSLALHYRRDLELPPTEDYISFVTNVQRTEFKLQADARAHAAICYGVHLQPP